MTWDGEMCEFIPRRSCWEWTWVDRVVVCASKWWKMMMMRRTTWRCWKRLKVPWWLSWPPQRPPNVVVSFDSGWDWPDGSAPIRFAGRKCSRWRAGSLPVWKLYDSWACGAPVLSISTGTFGFPLAPWSPSHRAADPWTTAVVVTAQSQ